MGYGPIQIRKFASSRLTSGWPIRRGSSPAKPDSTSRLILNSTKIGLRQGIVGSELALYAHGLDPVTLGAGNDSLIHPMQLHFAGRDNGIRPKFADAQAKS
jgi:hypothetical protein